MSSGYLNKKNQANLFAAKPPPPGTQMNNELLIIDKSGKAYRCVDHRPPVRGESFVAEDGAGARVIFSAACDFKARDYRHILTEVPSPYILREGVDELVVAAKDLRFAADSTFKESHIGTWDRLRDATDKLAAALEPFQSPPEVQERWRWEGDSIFDGDTEFNIANVEGCTELVAALNANELSKDGQ